jgi:hypothetical protein
MLVTDYLKLKISGTITFLAFAGVYWTMAEAIQNERIARGWNPQMPVECISDWWSSARRSYERLDVTQTGLTESQIRDIRQRIASGICRPFAPGQS